MNADMALQARPATRHILNYPAPQLQFRLAWTFAAPWWAVNVHVDLSVRLRPAGGPITARHFRIVGRGALERGRLAWARRPRPTVARSSPARRPLVARSSPDRRPIAARSLPDRRPIAARSVTRHIPNYRARLLPFRLAWTFMAPRRAVNVHIDPSVRQRPAGGPITARHFRIVGRGALERGRLAWARRPRPTVARPSPDLLPDTSRIIGRGCCRFGLRGRLRPPGGQ